MSFTAPHGWEKDSEKLYVHRSGARIQLMTYREKEGWFLIPAELDQPLIGFLPTSEGRDKAFEAFAKPGPTRPPRVRKPAPTDEPEAPPEAGKNEDEDDEDDEEDKEDEDKAEPEGEPEGTP
ncbi:MAG: hypothetical protein HYY16_17570 [Planctomycetes bacterium]|nr:hypothetical protein [Planctomycetota bacterium]